MNDTVTFRELRLAINSLERSLAEIREAVGNMERRQSAPMPPPPPPPAADSDCKVHMGANAYRLPLTADQVLVQRYGYRGFSRDIIGG